jgi:hypothetical protein
MRFIVVYLAVCAVGMVACGLFAGLSFAPDSSYSSPADWLNAIALLLNPVGN